MFTERTTIGWLLAAMLAGAGTSAAQLACAPGATCTKVDDKGKPQSAGTFVAQCSGTYPDYVDQVPSTWTDRRFKLSQDYPTQLPTGGPTPWKQHDFKTAAGADAYLLAVRGYVYDGMLAAKWRAEDNTVRRWYHVPWMTLRQSDRAPLPREFIHGMTQERQLRGPELGLKTGRTAQNWAIGYYNDSGGFAIGKVWKDPTNPVPAESQFPEHTVVVKVLFTAAKPDDFTGGDLLVGAPEWDANVRGSTNGTKQVQTMRLVQMDVAIRDDDAPVTGWVFGTFAYDKDAAGTDGWQKMAPVGLMWGNDPDVDADGEIPDEGIVSAGAPAYAKAHLGARGRVNGPVDNPASACLSCHATAQIPSRAAMVPESDECSASEKQEWFRNISGKTPFGFVNRDCELSPDTTGLTALDYSLQMAVALRAFRTTDLVNPCLPTSAPGALVAPAPRLDAAPRGEYDVAR